MGFIFAAKQFKSFAYTPGGMHYLLIPATHFEKLVNAILLTTIYYFTMFTVTYSIGNVLGTTLYNLVFTLGSIYFKRSAIGKTLLSIFTFYFIVGMIELFFLKVIFVDLSLLRGMSSINFMSENSTLLSTIGDGFKVFTYLLIPFFWTVSYFRLTEKQV